MMHSPLKAARPEATGNSKRFGGRGTPGT